MSTRLSNKRYGTLVKIVRTHTSVHTSPRIPKKCMVPGMK